jgi:hypothetical protein
MSTTTQNNTATIEATIEGALRTAGLSTYQRQAQPVIQALVEREQAIAERLLDYATDNGASTDEVAAMLADLGMSLKPEEPETEEVAEPAEQGDVATALANIQRTLEGLTQFARANGYRG